MVFAPALPSFAAKKDKDTKMSNYKSVKSAYVMDATTGQTLYSDKGDKKLPIASLSKLMTLYLTTKAIQAHKISWNEKVPVSKELIKMSKSYELGTFKIKESKEYTVKQLYQAALIASSNSSAIALGELVAGGSNSKFISEMNQQAKKWGIDATFVSASGLDNTDLRHYGLQIAGTSKKAQNEVSAKAISIVAQKLLKLDGGITRWSSLTSKTIGNQTLTNVNALLKGGAYYRSSNHVTGLKNGYTETAGLCLTTTYYRDGHLLIATVLGSDTIFTTTNGLITHLDKVLDHKEVTLKTPTYHVKNHQVKTTTSTKKVLVWYLKNKDADNVAVKDTLTAKTLPVKKGATVATTKFTNTGLPTATSLTLQAKNKVASDKATQSKTAKQESLMQKIADFFGHLF
ncbi:S11 family D-Ala-D-Ala carboxypeptidase [Secundilactobacillus collinoides DSM 20515 = JCM 1123]|uniref:S11 family D-Ala-D-Ala carboxypeptidase n=2 Tax=Secundilactobacillus collinoides TaxID=33960 RepID=A0A0R2BBG5_SECCO|nr:S11 family D-Ala-D-Ala carboxypeptidase [Secundilactobacillus collinoides DSM 20515 = JCM 1123]